MRKHSLVLVCILAAIIFNGCAAYQSEPELVGSQYDQIVISPQVYHLGTDGGSNNTVEFNIQGGDEPYNYSFRYYDTSYPEGYDVGCMFNVVGVGQELKVTFVSMRCASDGRFLDQVRLEVWSVSGHSRYGTAKIVLDP